MNRVILTSANVFMGITLVKQWELILASRLEEQWKSYRKALKRCRRQPSAKAVHASRVQARRLLAQLELLGIFTSVALIGRARRALKEHLNLFNPLRDTQVQLSLLDEQAKKKPTKTKELRHAVRRREKRCHEKAARGVRLLKTAGLKKLITDLSRQLRAVQRQPERREREGQAVRKSVNAAFARVVDRRAQMDATDVKTIHRTRVAFKRFRYMVEALQPLLPSITRARLRAMHSFQRVLGDLQDTEVFLDRVEKLAQKDKIDLKRILPFWRWLQRRRTEQIRQALAQADTIDEFWPLRKPRRAPRQTRKEDPDESLFAAPRPRHRARDRGL
jgi:CHAD domain-containing protein